ncbi:MAG: hypothetical protein MUC36_09125 [Planctomycetes bacterium]|jgi:hypothetical protein|nr:hypothetical protein [Planctomycetota bacterium]
MRTLIGLAVFFVIVLVGLVGFVVMKESERGAQRSGPVGRASAAVIETISHGEEVDIASLIPASGYTIVEFEADF